MALFDTLTNLLPAAGTVLGGPVGGAIGTMAAGALQGGQANKLMDKMWAQDNQIPLYDPMQQAALQKVRQQEKQFRAGTDPNSALANRMVGQAAAQTQANLMRGGGPGLVQNLLTSQRTAGNQYAQIGANAAAAANQMLPMELNLVGDMAKRAYDRQRYRRDIYFAQAEQRRQDANNNMMAGIGLLPELNIGDGLIGMMRKKASSPAPASGVSGFTSLMNRTAMASGAPGTPMPSAALPANYSLGDIATSKQMPIGSLGYATPVAPTNFGFNY